MTALDDLLKLCDEVLALDETARELEEELSVGYSSSSDDSLAHLRERQGKAAPAFARALRAVADALDEVGPVRLSPNMSEVPRLTADEFRAAIERRLAKEP